MHKLLDPSVSMSILAWAAIAFYVTILWQELRDAREARRDALADMAAERRRETMLAGEAMRRAQSQVRPEQVDR